MVKTKTHTLLQGVREVLERHPSVRAAYLFGSFAGVQRQGAEEVSLLLVDDGPEDSRALADQMLHLANNHRLPERLGNLSAKKIQGHTLDRWAEDFEEIVQTLVSRARA